MTISASLTSMQRMNMVSATRVGKRMAEFQEVMRQRARMCKAFDAQCHYCELEGVGCDVSVLEDLDRVERTIMDWAAEHPEPRYPTWEEWYKSNFPNVKHPVCPDFFSKDICDLYKSCDVCRAQPMPADIAQKLGIKPVAEKQ